MIVEVMDYADAVLFQQKATPPQDLQNAWKIKAHGMPYAGGWMEQPAGLLNRAMTALNVYDSYMAWYVSDRAVWQAEHKEAARVVGMGR